MNDYKTKEVDYSNQGKLYDCEGKTDMVLKRHGHMNIGQDYWRVYGIERKNQKNETILSLVVDCFFQQTTLGDQAILIDAKTRAITSGTSSGVKCRAFGITVKFEPGVALCIFSAITTGVA